MNYAYSLSAGLCFLRFWSMAALKLQKAFIKYGFLQIAMDRSRYPLAMRPPICSMNVLH